MKQKNNNMNLITNYNLNWTKFPYIIDDSGSNKSTFFLTFGASLGCKLSDLEYYINNGVFPNPKIELEQLGHSYVGETCYSKDNKLRSNTLVCAHDLIRTPSSKPPTNFAIPTKEDLKKTLTDFNKNVNFSPGEVGGQRGSLSIGNGYGDFTFSFNGYFKVNKEDKKITHEGTIVKDRFMLNQDITKEPSLQGQYIWSNIYLLTNTFNDDFTKYYVVKLEPNVNDMFEPATFTVTIDDGGGGGGEPVPTGTTEETGAVSTYSSRYIQKWVWTYNKSTKEFKKIQQGYNPESGFEIVRYYNGEESSKQKTVTISIEEWPIDENIYNLFNVLPIYCDELTIGLEEGKVFKNGYIDFILNQTSSESVDKILVLSDNGNNFFIKPTIQGGIIEKKKDIYTTSTNSISNFLVFLNINGITCDEVSDVEIIGSDFKQFSIKYRNNYCKLTISVNGYSGNGVPYEGYDNSLFYYDGMTINIDTNKLFRNIFKLSLGLKIELNEEVSKVYNKIPLPSIYKPYYTENFIFINQDKYLTIINKIHNGVGLYEEILLNKDNEEEYDDYIKYNQTLVSPTNVNDVKTYSIENYVGFLPEELRKTNGLRITPNGVALSSYNICELTNKISFRDSKGKEIFNYGEVSMVNRDKALFFCDEYEGTVINAKEVDIENEIKKDEDTDENVKVYNLKLNNIKYNAKYLSVIDEYLNNKLNEDIDINIDVNFANIDVNKFKYYYHDGGFDKIIGNDSFEEEELYSHIDNHEKYKVRYYFVNLAFVYEYIYGLIDADNFPLNDFFYEKNEFGFSNMEFYEMFPEKLDFNMKDDNGDFILSYDPNKVIPFFNMYPSIAKNKLFYGGGTIDDPKYNINAPIAFEINKYGGLENKFSMALEYPENPGYPQFKETPPSHWFLIGCYSELTSLTGSLEYTDTNYYKELFNGNVLNKHENFNTIIKFYGEMLQGYPPS